MRRISLSGKDTGGIINPARHRGPAAAAVFRTRKPATSPYSSSNTLKNPDALPAGLVNWL